MKNKPRPTVKLEAELLRLNTLLRERRRQLARLEQCPHHDCECRQVWKEVVESKLATQVSKVRKHVRGTPSIHSGRANKPKRKPRRRSA